MDDALAARRCDMWEELCLFLDGSPTSFRGQLLSLVEKADPGNRHRLREAFPREVAAWEAWCRLAPCTWGELAAALPAEAARRTVTFDVSDTSASFVVIQALEDFAAGCRAEIESKGGDRSRERWADLADQFRAQAEAAG